MKSEWLEHEVLFLAMYKLGALHVLHVLFSFQDPGDT